MCSGASRGGGKLQGLHAHASGAARRHGLGDKLLGVHLQQHDAAVGNPG